MLISNYSNLISDHISELLGVLGDLLSVLLESGLK